MRRPRHLARIDDLPLFNQDVFDAGLPEPAKRFRAEVTAADGVLIASPEYNFSLSAALKNAIDWGSRPPNQSWQDKPVAIFSASGLLVHSPCGPRKSGMPESVEIPAPVSTTTRRAPSIQPRTVAIAAS